MKLGKSLIISFVLLVLLNIYFFASLYSDKRQADNIGDWIIHTHLVIAEITGLNTLATNFEALNQDFVIADNKDFIPGLDSARTKLSLAFDRIKRLTADNPAQQNNLRLLHLVFVQKTKYHNHVFDVLKKSHADALLLLGDPEEERLSAEVKRILASMLGIENILLKRRTEKYKEALHGKFFYSIGFAVLVLMLLSIAFYKIYRENVNRKIAEEEVNRSEAKYKGLIEKSSLIIYTTDLYGRFTYISDKGLELTGYKMEELIGQPFTVLVPPDQKREIEKFYLNQYKHFFNNVGEEFEIRTKDNNRKIIQLSTVLLEENGKTVGFQSIARDITEVKYVESLIKDSKVKLQQQQEEYNLRLQSVINNIPMILYIKDLEGHFVMVNKNFTDIFGMSEDMIIGRTNYEIPRFSKRAEFYENIDLRVKKTSRPIEFEEVVFSNNTERNFLVTKFPLFDKDNELFAISSVAKDITDMTHNRQQLIDARLKAEKAEQLQEAFLANMSHEIRTPMNGIMGMTNMLLDTSLDSEQQEYAELIKRSSDTLLILINDILDLSKIKAGRMELETIDFSIKAAVQNVLQPMKLNLKKNIDLNFSVSNEVPEFVKGDSHKLFQILNNLISNAIKFTEKGEIKANVDVVKKENNQIYIKFDISDSGIGISENHIEHIFENFTQAGNDTVRRFGGTGLGLAITKKLVELQNGSIRVESTLGKGTVFHVEIPYLLSDAIFKNLPTGNIGDINLKGKGIENKRILIAEDNVINQRVLTSVLQKIKASWDIANNGKEAVEKLENGNIYDLIILDLQMPLMDGFEAAEYIRTKLKINTPIIAMTASTLRNEKVKCFDIGMNDYLAKPFSPDELIRHIHHLINPVGIEDKQAENKEVSTEKLYDLSYLYELENDEYLIEMLELFFESTGETLEEIAQSAENKNWDAVSKGSHKLKSSLGPLQITKMLGIASAMEEKARDPDNAAEIIKLNNQLHAEYAIVKPMIEAELEKAKKMNSGFATSEMV